jgi:hypothetical protein
VVGGPHLVVVLGDLPDADLVAARPGLVLLDELVAEIEPRAGLGQRAFDVPARVDHAERGPAGCVRFGRAGDRPGKQRKRSRAAQEIQTLHYFIPGFSP